MYFFANSCFTTSLKELKFGRASRGKPYGPYQLSHNPHLLRRPSTHPPIHLHNHAHDEPAHCQKSKLLPSDNPQFLQTSCILHRFIQPLFGEHANPRGAAHVYTRRNENPRKLETPQT